MNKETKLYLKVCGAVSNGKVSLFNASRYKKVLLNIPDGVDKSPASYQSLFLLSDRLNTLIEQRKEKYWSIAKPLLIGVIGAVIASIIVFFLLRLFQGHQDKPQNQNIAQPQSHKQPKELYEPSPSTNHSTHKSDQQDKKAK